jgi:hypothetical protein
MSSVRKWLWMVSILVPPAITWSAGEARRDFTISSRAELNWVVSSLAGGWICLWFCLRAFPVLPGWLKWLVLGLYAILFGVFLIVLSMVADNLSFIP